MPRIDIGPVSIDTDHIETVIEKVRDQIARRAPGQIVTLNALMFKCAENDKGFAAVLSKARLVVIDSVGMSLAVRLLKGVRVTRIPGIDLLINLCSLSSVSGYRVFLLGGRPGIAEAAAGKLAAAFPGLIIAGTRDGYFSPDNESSVLEAVKAARADILFVGLDVPRQEKWIAAHLSEMGVPAVIGVGGSFDVISGNLRRAPEWMRRTGLEWLFRTLQQPWRIARVKALPLFVLHVLKLKARTLFAAKKA